MDPSFANPLLGLSWRSDKGSEADLISDWNFHLAGGYAEVEVDGRGINMTHEARQNRSWTIELVLSLLAETSYSRLSMFSTAWSYDDQYRNSRLACKRVDLGMKIRARRPIHTQR